MDYQNETWANIPFSNTHQVSTHGRVRCLINTVKVALEKPRLVKPVCGGRYLQVVILGKTYKVHRLVALAFVPNPYGKDQVNHIDADKSNNHYTNLEWCTMAENNAHRNEYKLCLVGENAKWSKLNNEQVAEIKAMLTSGLYSHRQIASKFGVTHQSIQAIGLNRNWKHIPWPKESKYFVPDDLR